MSWTKHKVCLCMIVKNEAHVIERCLRSVLPFINSWCIVDTGSTDRTREIIREIMKDKPGMLFDRAWVNFAHNRSEAVKLAHPLGDYLFVIDADNVLVLDPEFDFDQVLDKDAYQFEVRYQNIVYYRFHLIRTALNWRYDGVVHEHLATGKVDKTIATLPGVVYQVIGGGARSLNPSKYDDDVKVLEQALENDPTNARYMFYLAQSYRDAGRLEEALAWYNNRYMAGGWDEEVWYSAFQIACLRERLNQDSDRVRRAYAEAYWLRPWRGEPLIELIRYLRQREVWGDAYFCVTQLENLENPPKDHNDVLFLNTDIPWRLAMEKGLIQAGLGFPTKALECLNKAVDLAPEKNKRWLKFEILSIQDQLRNKV